MTNPATNSNDIRTNGTPVTGTYFGRPFAGIIESSRSEYGFGNTYAVTVTLSEPFEVLGTLRNSILVSVVPARDWKSGKGEHYDNSVKVFLR